MTTVFADEIMPRAKHFSVKTFGLAADARFLDSWRLVGRGVAPITSMKWSSYAKELNCKSTSAAITWNAFVGRPQDTARLFWRGRLQRLNARNRIDLVLIDRDGFFIRRNRQCGFTKRLMRFAFAVEGIREVGLDEGG